MSSETKYLQGQQPRSRFVSEMNVIFNVSAPDGKPHLVKARPWQEAYRLLRFEASAWLLPCSSPAKAVMESPPVSSLCDGNVCPSAKILLFTHR